MSQFSFLRFRKYRFQKLSFSDTFAGPVTTFLIFQECLLQRANLRIKQAHAGERTQSRCHVSYQALNHQCEIMTLSLRFCSITSPGKVHQELKEGPRGKMQILTQECWGSQRVCIPSKLAGDALSAIAQVVLRGKKLGYYLISCASGTLKPDGQF